MLSRKDAQIARIRILSTLDADDCELDHDGSPMIDLCESFTSQMWDSETSLRSWARSWGLEATPYTIPTTRADRRKAKWWKFRKPIK